MRRNFLIIAIIHLLLSQSKTKWIRSEFYPASHQAQRELSLGDHGIFEQRFRKFFKLDFRTRQHRLARFGYRA